MVNDGDYFVCLFVSLALGRYVGSPGELPPLRLAEISLLFTRLSVSTSRFFVPRLTGGYLMLRLWRV